MRAIFWNKVYVYTMIVLLGVAIVLIGLFFLVWWSFLDRTSRFGIQAWAMIATVLIPASLFIGSMIGRRLAETNYVSRVIGWDDAMDRAVSLLARFGLEASDVRFYGAKRWGVGRESKGSQEIDLENGQVPWLPAVSALPPTERRKDQFEDA